MDFLCLRTLQAWLRRKADVPMDVHRCLFSLTFSVPLHMQLGTKLLANTTISLDRFLFHGGQLCLPPLFQVGCTLSSSDLSPASISSLWIAFVLAD